MRSFSMAQWVPVGIAARELRVSRQRVYELIKNGGLAWCKMGSLVLVGRASIHARNALKESKHEG
jgi:excisionase family DNA binding protein